MCGNINSLYHHACSRNPILPALPNQGGYWHLWHKPWLQLCNLMSSRMKVFALVTVAGVGCGLSWPLHSINYMYGFHQWDTTSQFQTDLFLFLLLGTPIALTAMPSAHGPSYRVRHSWGRNRNGRHGVHSKWEVWLLFALFVWVWVNYLRQFSEGVCSGSYRHNLL